MSSILVVFTTAEGQTAKICEVLKTQLVGLGIQVNVADLSGPGPAPSVSEYDGVILAASVHAGKYQEHAEAFVRHNRASLLDKVTAFVSVGLAVAASEEAGQQQARDQVHAFLKETDWQPDQVEMMAGAFRFSQFPKSRQAVFWLAERLFRKQLDRDGWPSLSGDREYTDWKQVRQFAEGFAKRLERTGEPELADSRKLA